MKKAKAKSEVEITTEIENTETSEAAENTDTVEVSEETENTETVENTVEEKSEQPKVLYPELSEEQRIANLKLLANNITNHTYQRDMTSSELSELKDKHTEVAIKLYDLERKKKGFNDRINSEIKPVKEEYDELTYELKYAKKTTNGTCYEFINRAECKVYIYSADGILVDTRLPDDKEMEQISLKFIEDSEAADADSSNENEVETDTSNENEIETETVEVENEGDAE